MTKPLTVVAERKTGVKHAEVITARLVRDEGGWLRLVGLQEQGRRPKRGFGGGPMTVMRKGV